MLQTRPAFKPAARRTHEDGGLEQHRNPVVIVRNPDREVFVSGKDIPGQQFCRKPYCVDGTESLYLFLLPPVQNEIYIIYIVIYRKCHRIPDFRDDFVKIHVPRKKKESRKPNLLTVFMILLKKS